MSCESTQKQQKALIVDKSPTDQMYGGGMYGGGMGGMYGGGMGGMGGMYGGGMYGSQGMNNDPNNPNNN